MKQTGRIITAVALSIALAACATGAFNRSAASRSKAEIEKLSAQVFDFTKTRENDPQLREKMESFRKILSRGGPKLRAEWKLHDELLKAYADLKSRNQTQSPGVITVPAHSRSIYQLKSFCLNGSRAAPSPKERFEWKKKDAGIPYLKELVAIAASSKGGLSQEKLQGLIWNLGSGTDWEEYPPEMKEILLRIDPNAAIKLPSRNKERVKEVAKDVIASQLPTYGDVSEAVEAARGEYRRFEDIRQSIREIQSKYPLGPPSDELEAIDGSALYAETESEGYSSQLVTLYNPTDQPVLLNLSEYHLQPKREDIQRIALVPPPSSDQSSLLQELEELLYGGMLRLGIGFTPGINDVADAYELLFGKDFVTNEVLSLRERALSGLGLIAGSGAGYRYIQRVVHSPAGYVAEFERGLEKAGARAGLRIEQAETKNAVAQAEKSLAERRRASKIQTYSAEEANRTFDPHFQPPYKLGTKVTEFRSIEGDEWVRVHGPYNQEGDWIVRKESIQGLSPEQLRSKYSLPVTPSEVSDVRPDTGTRVRRGRVAQNFGGGSGAVQYQILDNRLPAWYSNRRPIRDL